MNTEVEKIANQPSIEKVHERLKEIGHEYLMEEFNRVRDSIREEGLIDSFKVESVLGLILFIEFFFRDRNLSDLFPKQEKANWYWHLGFWTDGDVYLEIRNGDDHIIVTGHQGNWVSFALIAKTIDSVVTKEGEDTRLRLNGRGMVCDITRILKRSGFDKWIMEDSFPLGSDLHEV